MNREQPRGFRLLETFAKRTQTKETAKTQVADKLFSAISWQKLKITNNKNQMTNKFQCPIFEIFGHEMVFPTNLSVASILWSGCFGHCDLQFGICYLIIEFSGLSG